MKSSRLYVICLSVLAGVFCYHNYSIYTGRNSGRVVNLSSEAARGQKLWQENNCFSCHQFYGLGGYLGPDLTNIYSAPGKGPEYIKAMLNSGVKSMPEFNFSNAEKHAITAYLKEIDQTGDYPNHTAEFDYTGWVKIDQKNEK